MKSMKGLKYPKGISPLIATVFTIMLGVTMLVIVLNVVNPTFKRAQDSSVITDSFQNLELINGGIKEVSSEAEGSKRTVAISVSNGEYRTNSTYDWLYFEYTPESDMALGGTKGDIQIEHGLEFMDYFNYYVNGGLGLPIWKNTSGQWTVSDYKYVGQNGLAYHNISGTLENYQFSGKITNVSGTSGGEIFVLPTNPESLVGFWTFDNATGSEALDYSGNRNNLTLTNMNTTGNSTSGWGSTGCKYGSCLKFDGINDYATIAESSNLDFSETQSFTILAWVKYAESGHGGTVFGKGIPGVSTLQYDFGASDTDTLQFCYNKTTDGTSSCIDPDPDMSLLIDTWHFVGVILNGTYATFSKDGALSSGVSYVGINDTSLNVSIGAGSSGTIGYFNGTIDEVLVFNRALSAGEITSLYETSVKKIHEVSGSQTVTTKTNVSIVLSNPAGQSKFDDIKVTRETKKLDFIVPYTNIEINGTLRLPKGDHQVQIKHMGTNTTLNKPIIEVTGV